MLFSPNDGAMNSDPEFWYREAKEAKIDAEVLFRGERYRGAIDSCHKMLEKTLKAFCAAEGVLKDNDKIHNLVDLSKKCGVYGAVDDKTRQVLHEMSGMHSKTNYPDDILDAKYLEQYSYANEQCCKMMEVFKKLSTDYERYHGSDS